MKRFLDFFLRRSLLVRLLIVSGLFVVISVALSIHGLFHLAHTWKNMMNGQDPEFSQPKMSSWDAILPTIMPDSVRSLLTNYRNLDKSLRKSLPETNKWYEYDFENASMTVDQASVAEEFIGINSSCPWTDILIFAGNCRRASKPFSPELLRMPFDMVFQYLYVMKKNDQKFSVVPGVSLLLKYTNITGWSSHFLIDALLEITGASIISSGLQRLYEHNLISKEEAREILGEMVIADSCRLSVAIALSAEATHMRKALDYLRSKAGWGYFLLSAACGDPADYFEKMILQQVEEVEKGPRPFWGRSSFYEKIGFSSFNVKSFLEDELICLARRAIIKQELALVAEIDETFLDPYSGKNLIQKSIDGVATFYSVGPDKKDDNGTGDDVTISQLGQPK